MYTQYFITSCLFIFSCLVIGALIGKQEGRNIEVMNSFELLSHTIDDRVHIDKEYYYTKEEQCEFFVFVKDLNAALYVLLFLSVFYEKFNEYLIDPSELYKKKVFIY